MSNPYLKHIYILVKVIFGIVSKLRLYFYHKGFKIISGFQKVCFRLL